MHQSSTPTATIYRPVIAILEDDQDLINAYGMLFKYQGFNAGIFDDNETCKEFIRINHPSVIVVDIYSDIDKNGLDFLTDIKQELGADMPRVLIASGTQYRNYKNHPALQNIALLGAFLKPFDIDKLVNTIEQGCHWLS